MKKKLIYSDYYHVDIGEHVFPTVKYKMIYEMLCNSSYGKDLEFINPEEAKDEEILLVHTREYLYKFKNGKLSPQETALLELPYSKGLVTAAWTCVQGSILAAKISLEHNAGLHIGGGFHHAFSDHGEGFCPLNDVAAAIKKLQTEKLIKKAMVIDCDLHQGNGTADIFKNDRNVFTFSIHQLNNYPFIKPKSSLDINLPDGTGDDQYLTQLTSHLPEVMKNFKPEIIIYIAGADPYQYDQLGGLNLTLQGLKKRDESIFEISEKYKIPVCVVLGGGYALNIKDTALIHYNTFETGLRFYR
jgi:acetoin utilization deacetylase AcuC-like enzyme